MPPHFIWSLRSLYHPVATCSRCQLAVQAQKTPSPQHSPLLEDERDSAGIPRYLEFHDPCPEPTNCKKNACRIRWLNLEVCCTGASLPATSAAILVSTLLLHAQQKHQKHPLIDNTLKLIVIALGSNTPQFKIRDITCVETQKLQLQLSLSHSWSLDFMDIKTNIFVCIACNGV